VIDVLCAYLRRLFFHHADDRQDYDTDLSDFADSPGTRLSAEQAAADRERQARLVAGRPLMGVRPGRF
jgi:hypothetical protein